jgi:large subunit ribosomal protein L35
LGWIALLQFKLRHYQAGERLAFRPQPGYNPRLPDGWRRFWSAQGHASPSPPKSGERTEMPKLKTKSGAKKRFKLTASGKVKAAVAHKRHRLISKPKKMKRKARGTFTLDKGDAGLVLTYMPYMRG